MPASATNWKCCVCPGCGARCAGELTHCLLCQALLPPGRPVPAGANRGVGSASIPLSGLPKTKRCPKCGKTFPEGKRFCNLDATPLV